METPRPPATADDDHGEFTLEELAQRVGISPRTIRYYIAEGLLPGPGARGKSATYGVEHLVRLRLIRLLSARHLPLAEIQALLRSLALRDAKSLLAAEEERSGDLLAAERSQSPRDYISALLDTARQGRRALQPRRGSAALPEAARRPSSDIDESPAGSFASPPSAEQAERWSRWVLAPGVELQVRADALTAQRALIRRLLQVAGVQNIVGTVDEPGGK
jgi:DNA-binding transcriptional MerR regulator